MTDAETFLKKPDDDWKAVLEHLPELSASSSSTSRHDREFEDGSSITVTSENGEEVVVTVNDPPPDDEPAA